ncbi:MAG: YeeE/YedE thiosulfate transporter family protein [Pseudomonadota bacterium]
MLTLLLSTVLAFLCGFAIRRGSICAVVAAQMLVRDRRSTRMRAFGLAAAASGAVILPLHWMMPDAVHLSPDRSVGWAAIAGGAVFGLGARLNEGCVLGTLSHLTGGRTDYAFTVVGMIAGALATYAWHGLPDVATDLSPLEAPGPLSLLVAAVFMLTVGLTLQRRARRWLRDLRAPGVVHFGPFRAMLVIGLCGGLLHALAGGWTYMSVLSDHALWLADPTKTVATGPTAVAMAAAGAVVAGGIVAALRSGTFHWRGPTLRRSTRCLAGGCLMGGGAYLVPGGNGALIVHGVPSLAGHALASYAVMTIVLCASFLPLGPRPGGHRHAV